MVEMKQKSLNFQSISRSLDVLSVKTVSEASNAHENTHKNDSNEYLQFVIIPTIISTVIVYFLFNPLFLYFLFLNTLF